MTTFFWLIIIGCILCVGWMLHVEFCKAALEEQRKILEKASQERFAELIYRFNHEGPIPPDVSMIGMSGLISWDLEQRIAEYYRLLDSRDWNTAENTQRLNDLLNDVMMLNRIAKDFDEKRRNLMKEFEKDQGL